MIQTAPSNFAHPAVTYGLDLKYDPSANGTFSKLDQFGQITDQEWVVAGTNNDEHAYGYDYNGNRKYRQDPGYPMDQLYTYDTLDRLTDMQRGTLNGTYNGFTGTVAQEQQYTLDELGNWSEYLTKASGTTNLDQTRAHTAANETGTITHVTGTTWVSPSYDLAGNMVQGPKPGSEATNLKFIYDGWNRMVQVTDNSSTIIATYRFDGQNHRIQKLLGSNPASPTSYYDYYYNENWQVMEERLNGSGTTLNAQYVWDPRYIDAPVVRFGALGTVYYCEDANMNVTSLTNTTGLAVERYSYDAYGQVHFYAGSYYSYLTSSSYGNEILFGGYRYDPETGLYHVRNRMYHPTLGKWMQFDPMGYVDGNNIFQYAASNPAIWVDALGTQVIASSPTLHTTESIKDLDATIDGGSPFADLASEYSEAVSKSYDEQLKVFKMTFPTFTSAGVQHIENKAMPGGIPADLYRLSAQLFYITIPICSKNSENARVTINEKVKSEDYDGTKWSDTTPVDAKDSNPLDKVTPAAKPKTGSSTNMRIAKLKKPFPGNPPFDMVIIVVDIPTIDSQGFAKMAGVDTDIKKSTVNATLTVTDGKNDITSIKYSFTEGWDEKGVLLTKQPVVDATPTTKP